MLQPTIAPVKKNATAIAAAALLQPVIKTSNTRQIADVITEKPIRQVTYWINPEYDESSPLFNPKKTLQDWLICPNADLNLVDLNMLNLQYPDLFASLNIDINNISVSTERTHTNNTPIVRKARVIVNNADMTELAEISLGYWRNIYMKDSRIENVLIGRRVTETAPDGKIIYTTVISCNNADVDIATKLIKTIAHGTKTVIDWL